jgi:hypothetical protein
MTYKSDFISTSQTITKKSNIYTPGKKTGSMASLSPSSRRIVLAGILAIIVSVAVNIAISVLATHYLQLSTAFAPLGIGPVIFWSVVLGLGALAVFGMIKRWSKRPLLTYILISIGVYLCTFIPDAWLLSSSAPALRGLSASAVLTLMTMHAAEAIILLGTFSVLELRQR